MPNSTPLSKPRPLPSCSAWPRIAASSTGLRNQARLPDFLTDRQATRLSEAPRQLRTLTSPKSQLRCESSARGPARANPLSRNAVCESWGNDERDKDNSRDALIQSYCSFEGAGGGASLATGCGSGMRSAAGGGSTPGTRIWPKRCSSLGPSLRRDMSATPVLFSSERPVTLPEGRIMARTEISDLATRPGTTRVRRDEHSGDRRGPAWTADPHITEVPASMRRAPLGRRCYAIHHRAAKVVTTSTCAPISHARLRFTRRWVQDEPGVAAVDIR